MKFLVDAHLPKSICGYFINCECIYTSDLETGNITKDTAINTLSLNEKRIVITKDTDFYYSYIISQRPYKLVLVKLGNMRLAEIKRYFKDNSKKMLEILEKHSFIVLERSKIRILE